MGLSEGDLNAPSGSGPGRVSGEKRAQVAVHPGAGDRAAERDDEDRDAGPDERVDRSGTRPQRRPATAEHQAAPEPRRPAPRLLELDPRGPAGRIGRSEERRVGKAASTAG